MDSFLLVALLFTVRPCERVQLLESPALKLQDVQICTKLRITLL